MTSPCNSIFSYEMMEKLLRTVPAVRLYFRENKFKILIHVRSEIFVVLGSNKFFIFIEGKKLVSSSSDLSVKILRHTSNFKQFVCLPQYLHGQLLAGSFGE